MESKVFGVPVVAYRIPNLDMMRRPRGMKLVKQHDGKAAADEVIRLLKDRESRYELRHEAFAEGRELASFDILGNWRKIFELAMKQESCQDPTPEAEDDASLAIRCMLDSLNVGLFGQMSGTPNNTASVPIPYYEPTNGQLGQRLNEHEEILTRHEQVVNDDWAWLKELERRVRQLETHRLAYMIKRLFGLAR